MKRDKSALRSASRLQITRDAPLEEIEAALAVVDSDARLAPPVLLPPLTEQDGRDSLADPVTDVNDSAGVDAPAPPEPAPLTTPTPVLTTPTPVVAVPTPTPVRRSRGRGRPTSAQTQEVLACLHQRFPRGMTSWSANLRVSPALVRELDDWKWRFFTAHQREALNTRVLTVALERITPEDLSARAEQLRSVDPATNFPWAVRIPASMRLVMIELTRATVPPLDKSQVGAAALAKFLDDFAELAPKIN